MITPKFENNTSWFNKKLKTDWSQNFNDSKVYRWLSFDQLIWTSSNTTLFFILIFFSGQLI